VEDVGRERDFLLSKGNSGGGIGLVSVSFLHPEVPERKNNTENSLQILRLMSCGVGCVGVEI